MAILKGVGAQWMSGKAGTHVYRNLNGQVVMTQAPVKGGYATRGYSLQSSRINNVLRMYRVFGGRLRGGFELKRAGHTDYNCFMSINSIRSKVFTSPREHKTNLTVLAPYQVSLGTLTEVEYHEGITNIALGQDVLPRTVGEFADLVTRNNETFMYGDRITAFVLRQEVDGMGVPVVSLKCFRVELVRDCDRLLTEFLPDYVGVRAGFLAIDLPEGISGYAVVHSRRTDGGIRVSSQTLELSSTEVMDRYGDPRRAGVKVPLNELQKSGIGSDSLGFEDGWMTPSV